MNAKMSAVKRSFEDAGFTEVKTVLASGNVVFSARPEAAASLQRKAEAAMAKRLGRSFMTIVRPIAALRKMMTTEPYLKFKLLPNSKRVVTFLRHPQKLRMSLPIERDGARILSAKGGEIFTAYLPGPRGPVFMTLIDENLGKEVTTRTWETVKKVAK